MLQTDTKAAFSEGLDGFLTQEFARSKPGERYLFTCRFTKVMRLNMLILRLCLQGRAEKGIYVSIDRPHSYTQHNLKALGVPQDGLIYIDAISRLTGQRAVGSQVRFLSDGFTLPLLDDLFSRAFLAEGAQRHFIKMEEQNFILLDNVQELTKYLSMDRARRILTGLGDLVKKYTAMRTMTVMDPVSGPDLCAFLRDRCDRELAVREEWL